MDTSSNSEKRRIPWFALLILICLFSLGILGMQVFARLGAGTTDIFSTAPRIQCSDLLSADLLPFKSNYCGPTQPGPVRCVDSSDTMCKVAVNVWDDIGYGHYCIPSTSSCDKYSYDGFRGFLASEEPVKCYDEDMRRYMVSDGNKCLSAANITVECPASKPYVYKSLTSQYAPCILANDPKTQTESVLLCEESTGDRYYLELGSRNRISTSGCFNEDKVVGCPKTFKLVQVPYTFTSTRAVCVSETQASPPPPPPPPTPLAPSSTLPKPSPPQKPKPATTESAPICGSSEGLCKKGAVQECMSTCPANWTFILPEGWTIVPSSLGSKYVTGMKDGKTLEEPTLSARTITVREIVKEEVPVQVSISPPKEVNSNSCAEYQKAVSEEVVLPGQSVIESAGARLKEVKVKNPDFQKAFVDDLRKAVRTLREVDKTRAKLSCTPEGITKLSEAVLELETGDLKKVKQGLVFIDEGVKVQNKWLGIQEIFDSNRKIIKMVLKDPKQAKLFHDEIEGQSKLDREFQELLEIEKTEWKVFEFEVEAILQEAKDLKKSFEEKLKILEKPKDSEKTLRKGSLDKKVLKKSSKKKKKKLKKNAK